MKQLVTQGIVLSRTDYGEADRIVTLLTPEAGKLRLMARGVRKVKSKLAGGIELFSISDITYMPGKGDMGTLISARLNKHYGNIISDIDRVQLGYDLIKQLNKATEDHPEPDYFELLQQAFMGLNDGVDLELLQAWFQAQLLRLAGHTPNLHTDTKGHKLIPESVYTFDFEAMSFEPNSRGSFTAKQIKVLRLLFGNNSLQSLAKVQGLAQEAGDAMTIVRTMSQLH